MTDTKKSCPGCGRGYGLRWRVRSSTFVCTLCGTEFDQAGHIIQDPKAPADKKI